MEARGEQPPKTPPKNIKKILDQIELFEVYPKIFALVIKDDKLRARVFLRYQEFYESDSDSFRGKGFKWKDYIDFYKEKGYKGLVIEATGLGHVGTEESKFNWLPSIKSAIESGMTICFAPQTLYGRLNPYIYSPARKLLDAGVIFLEDMLPETALVKLGCILAEEKDAEKIRAKMLYNYANEFNQRLSEKAFLF